MTTNATQNLSLPYVVPGQMQPEVPINEALTVLDSLSGSFAAFGWNQPNSSGLTFAYYGGSLYNAGSLVAVAAGTLALPASSTSYVEMTTAGAVSANTSGFTAGQIPLATVVTSATAITSVADARPAAIPVNGLANPMTAQGDLITGGASGTPERLAGSTTEGYVLTYGPSGPEWAAPPVTGMTNPMTTAGDIIIAGANGLPTRLGVGAQGQTLTVDAAGDPAWATPSISGAGSTPMTTQGDIIIGGASGTPLRLGIGAQGQVLTVGASGEPAWEAAATFQQSLLMSVLPTLIIGGTPNATGLITLSQSLPPSGQFGNVTALAVGMAIAVYLPANVVVGDSVGGIYQASIVSSTQVQLTGSPATNTAAFSIASGTLVQLYSVAVPASSLANAIVDIDANAVGNGQFVAFVAGGSVGAQLAPANPAIFKTRLAFRQGALEFQQTGIQTTAYGATVSPETPYTSAGANAYSLPSAGTVALAIGLKVNTAGAPIGFTCATMTLRTA
jgi:hypothetical protein